MVVLTETNEACTSYTTTITTQNRMKSLGIPLNVTTVTNPLQYLDIEMFYVTKDSVLKIYDTEVQNFKQR